jgi:hypothetical protein
VNLALPQLFKPGFELIFGTNLARVAQERRELYRHYFCYMVAQVTRRGGPFDLFNE